MSIRCAITNVTRLSKGAILSVIAAAKAAKTGIADMKHAEAPLMKPPLLEQSRLLGAQLARLRVSRTYTKRLKEALRGRRTA